LFWRIRLDAGHRGGNAPNATIERYSIARIKIAGVVERLTVPSKKDRRIDGIDPWLTSILGLKESVGGFGYER